MFKSDTTDDAQIVQGDEWNLIMLDSMVSYPNCTPLFEGEAYGDCGLSFGSAVLLFASFKIVVDYMLVR